MPTWVREIRKALVATAIAGLGSLATALEDGAITQLEWVLVATAAVLALGAVWGVRNAPQRSTDADRDVLEDGADRAEGRPPAP